MTSRFSFSTTSSSPTTTIHTHSPPASPELPTSSTISSAVYLPSVSPTYNNRRISRWPALSKDGLPRSFNSSMSRPHRFQSSVTTPVISPSSSPRCPTPPPATTTTTTPTYPAQPAATPAQPSPPSPEPGRPVPRNALGLVEGGGTANKNKRNEIAIVRMGRSVGRGLGRCSGFFKRRPDDPDEVEEVPKPVHWSEY